MPSYFSLLIKKKAILLKKKLNLKDKIVFTIYFLRIEMLFKRALYRCTNTLNLSQNDLTYRNLQNEHLKLSN